MGSHGREVAAEARQGPAGADAADHRIEPAFHLLPDLGARRPLMRQRVGRIGELVDVKGAGGLAGQSFRHVLVVIGMAFADIGTSDPDVGAERTEMINLLLAHLVRNDEDQAIALLGGRERLAEAGIAGRRLNQQPAVLKAAVALGRLDHPEADTVLDRAAGILVFEFGEEPAGAGIEMRQLDERCVADRLQNIPID